MTSEAQPTLWVPSMPKPTSRTLYYQNPLAQAEDLADFITEGRPVMSFPQGKLRLENGLSTDQGQAANYLLWCPQPMPAHVHISWHFRPLHEPGLAMAWFAAQGHGRKDLFDPTLPPRAGVYNEYHHGSLNAYHLSYFRRKNLQHERNFHTCNLRKSHGFHLVAQGADPLPSVADVDQDYLIELTHYHNWVRFAINGLPILQWHDDGSIGGPARQGGYFGLRQMAPLIAEYSNLVIHELI